MRFNNYKYRRFCVLSVLLLTVFLGGCKPSKKSARSVSPPPRPSIPEPAVKETTETETAIEQVCEKILTGNFEDASEIISKSSTGESERLTQLVKIIDEYESVVARRKASKIESYREQVDAIQELRRKGHIEDVNEPVSMVSFENPALPTEIVVDVNDIGEAFLAIIKAREYADESQKTALLEEAFVKETVEKSLANSRKFEAEGKWMEAYAHCYYWLTNLDKDNSDYKAHADQLIEKTMIETSLMDNSCQTSTARHEGIRAEMVFRAIKTLDFNYVSLIDYGEMAEKALDRSSLLGQVMEKSAKKLAYQADLKKIKKWYSGVDAIKSELKEAFLVMTRDKFIKVFNEILALNEVTIDIPRSVIVARFSEAALQALDPHTMLYWPWQVKELQKEMTQEFTGIGIHISKVRGVLTVMSLMPGTPAYLSGLDAEDSILAVDSEPTDDMTLQCAVSKITGPAGTEVILTVKHVDSEKVEDITITRGKIIVPTIRGWQRTEDGGWLRMIDTTNKIGYIRITGFTKTTVPGMKEALKSLRAQGMKALIIDLRNNFGGYLVDAATIVDMFVSDGLIVKSQPRWGVSTYETAQRKGTEPGYPVAVLINGRSASASEIVAGALQDTKYKRAVIIGSQSYGKGSVQTIVPVSNDGSTQLKYTMAYYHLPSNQRVKNRYVMEKKGRKDWGIAPDVEIELRTDERIKKDEVQWANDVLGRADFDDGSRSVERYSLKETIDSDPQLAVAILLMKCEMIQAGDSIVFETTPAPRQEPEESLSR